MRDIKFRAWDKVLKYMLPFGNYVDMEGQVWEEVREVHNTPNTEIEPVDRIILMQYTGLKDTNGKEIYEGDIIKLSRYWADHLQTGCAEVFYTPLATFDIACSMVVKWDFYSIAKEGEVIGNIYENPELTHSKCNKEE